VKGATDLCVSAREKSPHALRRYRPTRIPFRVNGGRSRDTAVRSPPILARIRTGATLDSSEHVEARLSEETERSNIVFNPTCLHSDTV
jgi:hypothetical protein